MSGSQSTASFWSRRLRQIALVCLGLSVALPVGAAEPQPSARFLVVVLDAVPYETMVALTEPTDGEAPLFEGLRGPVPMISTFPSSTSVALTAILKDFGLEDPPGYENKFFDQDADHPLP